MYIINKSDGNIAATVNDGVADTNYTDLYLVGKNYQAYGQLINTNFVRLLENFADNNSPINPIVGQLWYNTDKAQLFQYSGSSFKNLNAVAVNTASPDLPQTGDFWYDSTNKQLKYYTADASWLAIAPLNTVTQGLSGPVVSTVNDGSGDPHTITTYYDGNISIAIHSADSFTPNPSIAGYGALSRGINLAALSIMKGTATNATALANLSIASFMRTDEDTATTGSLTVENDNGITIGSLGDLTVNMDVDGINIASTVPEANITFFVTDAGNVTSSVINIYSDRTVEIPGDLAASNLGVTGEATVTGNLFVGTDIDITGNLTLGVDATVLGTVATQNLSVVDNILSDTMDVVTGNIATVNSDLITVGTGSGNDAILVTGDIGLESTDTIYFSTGAANAHVAGDSGTLVLGAGGADYLTIDSYGNIVFLGAVDFTNVSISAVELTVGNIYHFDDSISQTLIGGDLRLHGGPGGGFVIADNFYVTGTNEAEVLELYSENDSIGLGTGSFTTPGGASIDKNLFVGSNLSVGGMLSFSSGMEDVNIVPNTPAGTSYNVNILDGGIHYYTANSSASWTPNFRGSAAVSLDSMMDIGQSITVTMMVTQGTTAYYSTDVKIDGTVRAVKWMGAIPGEGNPEGLDVYTYAIIKTDSDVFTVLAGQTNFASP